MDWTELLKTSHNILEDNIKTKFNCDPEISALAQSACYLTQRNISLFTFAADGGGSNNSYTDIMKTAIRRQIDLNQKITMPFIKEIKPIGNLSKKDAIDKEDHKKIIDYWHRNCSMPLEMDVQKIKDDASNYLHPTLSLRIIPILTPKETAQYIYDWCGFKPEIINNFISKLVEQKRITSEEQEFLRDQIQKLFTLDVQNMCNFIEIFFTLIDKFYKIKNS